MSLRLAWVTSRRARGRDLDEPLALAALASHDVDVEVVDWDDRCVAWEAFDRVVIRSAWDYPERRHEFDAWLRRVDGVAELVNPLPVMQWSMDKHYLAELESAGIPVTPSHFVEVGQRPMFPDIEAGFVVKPAVGAGSRDVVRYPATETARAAAASQIATLHGAGRSVVVQPALVNVMRLGEWPLVFLGGEYSHAASKRVELPAFGATTDLYAPEVSQPARATPEMIAVATAAVRYVRTNVGHPAYARIDLVLDDDGNPVVMEAELVEPSLFLPQHPPAAVRLAGLVAR
jgi:glutathione synthase/RimK-type ligase-like ATP-grasp enzyme